MMRKTTAKVTKTRKASNQSHHSKIGETVHHMEENIAKYGRGVGGVIALVWGLFLLAELALGLVLIAVGTIALGRFMDKK